MPTPHRRTSCRSGKWGANWLLHLAPKGITALRHNIRCLLGWSSGQLAANQQVIGRRHCYGWFLIVVAIAVKYFDACELKLGCRNLLKWYGALL